jgi:hypothetical protein
MTGKLDVLTSLNPEELRALADSHLAPSAQSRLDELLVRSNERALDESETQELDELLVKVDHLNILKTRARYTLSQQADSADQ